MEIWPREGLWHNLGQLFSLILFKLSHWDWKSWSRGPEEQILGCPRDTAGFLRWPWFPPFLMSSLFNFPWVLQNTLHYPLGGLKQLEFIVSQLWWPSAIRGMFMWPHFLQPACTHSPLAATGHWRFPILLHGSLYFPSHPPARVVCGIFSTSEKADPAGHRNHPHVCCPSPHLSVPCSHTPSHR